MKKLVVAILVVIAAVNVAACGKTPYDGYYDAYDQARAKAKRAPAR